MRDLVVTQPRSWARLHSWHRGRYGFCCNPLAALSHVELTIVRVSCVSLVGRASCAQIQGRFAEGGARLTSTLLEIGQLREQLDKAAVVKATLKEQVGDTRSLQQCGA
jgi:hypothetical protein